VSLFSTEANRRYSPGLSSVGFLSQAPEDSVVFRSFPPLRNFPLKAQLSGSKAPSPFEFRPNFTPILNRFSPSDSSPPPERKKPLIFFMCFEPFSPSPPLGLLPFSPPFDRPPRPSPRHAQRRRSAVIPSFFAFVLPRPRRGAQSPLRPSFSPIPPLFRATKHSRRSPSLFLDLRHAFSFFQIFLVKVVDLDKTPSIFLRGAPSALRIPPRIHSHQVL